MQENTKRRWLVACIVFSLLPPLFILNFPSLVSPRSLALWASGILGYIGIVLLLWMYMLGTKTVSGLFFKDLAPVLRIHKWIGKYGVLAIFAHPLLISFAYGESLLYSFIPLLGTQFERHITLGRIAFFLLLLTWLVSAYLRGKMAFRPWKYLHYLAYLCIPFALLHVPNVGSQYMGHQAIKVYFFVLVLTFIIFLLLRVRGFLNLDKYTYEIMSHIILSPEDQLLTLKPTGKFLTPNRGQYVYLKKGIISEDHPFSVAHFNEATGEISIAYRVFGEFTKFLQSLKKGDTVQLGGPFGTFTSDLAKDDPRAVIYISGGIGITPFFDRIMAENNSREQWLFAANRTRESAVLLPMLKKQLGERCVSILSKETSSLQPSEESGYFSGEVLKKYITSPEKYTYYMCGPKPMMNTVRRELKKLGVPDAQVETERFGW